MIRANRNNKMLSRPIKSTGRNLILLFIFLNALISNEISGGIYDFDTKEPIRSVNIWLIDTDKGTSSDKDGTFIITNLDLGVYELAFTAIGYEKEIITALINNEQPIKLNINLKPLSLILDEITVSGISKSQISYDLPTVISKQQIEQSINSSLTDIIGSTPGIDIQSAHSLGRNVNISIRGSSDYKPGGYNNRVMVLMDGMPVQIPNSGAADWNALPIDNINEIEISKGPSSALYGHNSMGGTINLITSSPILKNYNQIKTNISYGSFNNLSGLIHYNRHKGSISNGLSIASDKGNGHRFNSDFFINRLSHKIVISTSDQYSLTLSNILASSLNGQPGFLRSDGAGKSYRVSDRISSYNQINYKAKISDRVGLNSAIGINYFSTDYYDRNDTPIDEAEDSTYYRDNSIISRVEISYRSMDNLNWIAGYELGYDISDASVLNSIYKSPSQLTSAPFLQIRYKINNHWLLGGGIRFDYRNVDSGSSYGSRAFSSLSPKLNLTYIMKGQRIFQLSINKGFRAPSISELYLDHISPYGLPIKGNPQLNPESMLAFEMSYKSNFLNYINWDMSIFYNYYNEMIDFVYTYPVKSKNRTDIDGIGTEINLAYNDGTLSVASGYTFLNMNDVYNIDPILYRPKHKANISIGYREGILMGLISASYSSSQEYEDFLDTYTEDNGEYSFPIKTLPQTFVLNTLARLYLSSITITLAINNLLDTDYMLIQDYPMPGRTLEAKIEYKINKGGKK